MPSPYAGNPFSYHFGLFQTALNDPEIRRAPGGVQQYVWQGLRNEYLARGEPLPPGAFQAVNQLFSLAGQQRRAQANLARSLATQARTGLAQGVAAEHVTPHLDTRAPNEMTEGARYRVVYRTVTLVDGQPVTHYETHDFGYALPRSLDDLGDSVEEAAQLRASDYGYEWGGETTPVALYSY